MYKAIIVDDEELTRESLKQEIDWSELGIEIVAEAANGLLALELIQAWKPDILLSDIRMPKMDGIKLANNARSLFPDIKIVFLSAYSDKEYLKSAIQLKAVDYLEKPFETEDLLNIMKKSVSELNEAKDQKKNLEAIQGKLKSLFGLIEQVTEDIVECKDLDIAYIKNVYFSILFKFYEWLMDEELAINEAERNRDYLWNAFLSLNTVQEMKAYVLGEIKTLEAYLKAHSASNKTNTIDEIKMYIAKNYSEAITIMSIAEHLYLTHTYLCLVFKKATGKTINRYITEFRIEKSKQLLLEGQFSMELVAEKTGFKNAKYFSRVFKKMTGQNPSDFRRKADETKSCRNKACSQ